MEDTVFFGVFPPLKAKDNGDGTFSIAVSIAGMPPLTGMTAGELLVATGATTAAWQNTGVRLVDPDIVGGTFNVNTGLSDGEYSGTVVDGVAGAALVFGDLVYLAFGDSRWELAKADAEATAFGKLAICVLAAVGDGSVTKLLLWGNVRADAVFPALTIGAPIHISEATAGDVQVAAPTGTTGWIVRIVGYGNTADELFFCPDNTFVELA